MSNNYEWKRLADLPVKLYNHTQAAIGDHVYVYGGYSETTEHSDILYKYTISTNTWEIIPKSGTWPAGRRGHVMCAIGGKLYITGGVTTSAYETSTWEYTPETSTWVRKADIPMAKYLGACGVVDNEMVVVGGILASGTYSNATYKYNPISNTWSDAAVGTFSRLGLSAASVNNTLYFYGGGNAYATTAYGDMYTIENSAYLRKPDHSPVRLYHTSVSIGEKFYSLFGYPNTTYTEPAPCEVYDTVTGDWSLIPNSPSGRRLLASSVIANGFIVSGGTSSSGSGGNHEVWAYVEKEEPVEPTITWKRLPDLPVPGLYLHCQETIGKDTFVFGGIDRNGSYNNTLLKYTDGDSAWATIPNSGTVPVSRYNSESWVIDGKLYIYGGYATSNSILFDLWEYDPVLNTWSQKTGNTRHGAYTSAVVRNNKAVLISGRTSINPPAYSKSVSEYDPVTNIWTNLPDLPEGRILFSSAIDKNDNILIYGGVNTSISGLNTLWVYRPNNTTEIKPIHNPGRQGQTCYYHKENDKFYFFGGRGSTNNVLTTDIFTSYDLNTDTWETLSGEPESRMFSGISGDSSGFIISGGSFVSSATAANRTEEVWKCEFESDKPEKKYSWKRKADIPLQIGQVGTREGSQATIGTDVYLFGGQIKQTNNTIIDNDKLFKFDTILIAETIL